MMRGVVVDRCSAVAPLPPSGPCNWFAKYMSEMWRVRLCVSITGSKRSRATDVDGSITASLGGAVKAAHAKFSDDETRARPKR